MAKIEIMTMGGEKSSVLNIGQKVGLAALNGSQGGNRPDDVMLIQAMFRFIKKHNPGCNFSKAAQINDLPRVSGTFDPATLNMIDLYQRVNAARLLKVDRLIEPAILHGRNIVLRRHHMRVLTITALNHDCDEEVRPLGAILSPNGSSWSGGISGGGGSAAVFTQEYIMAIKFEFPQLNFLTGP